MNYELLVLKGLISELSPEDQEKIKTSVAELEARLKQCGEHEPLVFGLLAAAMMEKYK